MNEWYNIKINYDSYNDLNDGNCIDNNWNQ